MANTDDLNSVSGQNLLLAISKLRTVEEIRDFLGDLLSGPEITKIVNRWQAIELLNNKQNYLDIQKQTGLSSATIAKMSTSLKYGTGILRKILERMR